MAGQLLLFAVIAVAGLVALADSGSPTPWGAAASVVGLVAIGLGGLVAFRGVRDLQDSLSPFPRPVAGSALVDSGAYRLIRHPIYSGLLLASVGWGLVAGSLVVMAAAVLLFLLFVGKAHREEAWLVTVHPEYRAYQQRTKRFIPWIY